MIVLPHNFGVIVPDSVHAKVKDQLDLLTHSIGGCTKYEMRGEWYDADSIEHTDHGTHYNWWAKIIPKDLIHLVVQEMLAHGEKSVMVFFGGNATIFDKSDYPNRFSN